MPRGISALLVLCVTGATSLQTRRKDPLVRASPGARVTLLGSLPASAVASTKEWEVAAPSWQLYTACAAVVATLLLAPVVEPQTVAVCLERAPLSLPLLGPLTARALVAATWASYALRTRAELAFVLLHTMLTYAAGDTLAQAVLCRGSSVLTWQPLRTLTSGCVGVLSDGVPFVTFSLCFHAFSRVAAPLPSWSLVLLKVLLHVVVFQTVSNSLYLSLQAWLRGQGWRGVVAANRANLLRTCVTAGASFAVGGALVYSLPSVSLQSALRNVGVLFFSVYLALVTLRDT